jgi:hypothetical protein
VGTYNVFKSLSINNSNTEIYGAGIDKTIVSNLVTVPDNYFSYGSSACPSTISSINSSKITGIFIHDVTFNGNYYADNSYDGVDLSNVDDSSIYNVKTINSAGNCLLVTSMQISPAGKDWPHYDYAGLKSVENCIADNCSGEVFASFYDTNVLLTGNTANNLFLFNLDGKGAWLQTLDVEGDIDDTVSNNTIQGIPDSLTGFQNGGDLAVDAVFSINTNISNNTFIDQKSTYHISTISFDTGGEFEQYNTDVNLIVSGNHFINCGGITAYFDNWQEGAYPGADIASEWFGNIQFTDNVVENGSLGVQMDTATTVNQINISNNIINITSPDHSDGVIGIGNGGGNTAISDNVTICDNTINAQGITNCGSNTPIALDLNDLKDVTVTGNKISSSPLYGN